MGIKKDGKKLLKLGQKAAKRLGKEGKERVAEFFAKAIEVLERELEQERDGRPAKQRTTKAAARPRPAGAGHPAPRAKPERRAIRPKRAAPARTARPRPRAAHPVRAPAPVKPEPRVLTPTGQAARPTMTEDQP